MKKKGTHPESRLHKADGRATYRTDSSTKDQETQEIRGLLSKKENSEPSNEVFMRYLYPKVVGIVHNLCKYHPIEPSSLPDIIQEVSFQLLAKIHTESIDPKTIKNLDAYIGAAIANLARNASTQETVVEFPRSYLHKLKTINEARKGVETLKRGHSVSAEDIAAYIAFTEKEQRSPVTYEELKRFADKPGSLNSELITFINTNEGALEFYPHPPIIPVTELTSKEQQTNNYRMSDLDTMHDMQSFIEGAELPEIQTLVVKMRYGIPPFADEHTPEQIAESLSLQGIQPRNDFIIPISLLKKTREVAYVLEMLRTALQTLKRKVAAGTFAAPFTEAYAPKKPKTGLGMPGQR